MKVGNLIWLGIKNNLEISYIIKKFKNYLELKLKYNMNLTIMEI